MPIGHVALRIFGLLRRGGDRFKADIGEENIPRAAQNTAPAEMAVFAGILGMNGCQLAGLM